MKGELQPTRHRTDLTVRYAETDRMGVVYYSNYFIWFEVARTDHLKSKGISYKELEEKNGLYLMVVESFARYKAPATYDDKVTVESWVSSVKNASFSFEYNVYLGDKIIAEGRTAHVLTDNSRRPVKLPEFIRKRILP